MKKMKNYLFSLIVLLAFLAGCSGSGTPQLPTAATAVTTPPKPTLQLSPCRIGYHMAQCGTLKVYENRESQSGRMIDLKIVVVKATGDHPAPDPIFYLAGGPGGAAASEDADNQDYSTELYQTHDIVFVDQRGTGGSHEVPPPQTPEWSGLTPEELENAYADWISQQLPKLDMDPRYYTTSVAMDDLDEVRQALGYDKINLIGGSYGTIAAQYYLRQYEQHVRSIVLISGSLTDIPIWNKYAANTQHAMDAWFSRCEIDADCNAAYPAVRGEFAELLDRLETQPIVLNEGSYTISRDLFAAEVEFMLRDAVQAAKLPRLIHRAYTMDDWSAFGPQAGVDAWKQMMMSYSIQCSEKWSEISPEETARLGQGSFFLGWWLGHVNEYMLICKYFPKGITPEGTSSEPYSDVPVLLFNGEFDPLLPPEIVAGAKDIWPNSLALTLPGRSHAISDSDAQSCIKQITQKFVEDASVQGLPTDCIKDLAPITLSTYR